MPRWTDDPGPLVSSTLVVTLEMRRILLSSIAMRESSLSSSPHGSILNSHILEIYRVAKATSSGWVSSFLGASVSSTISRTRSTKSTTVLALRLSLVSRTLSSDCTLWCLPIPQPCRQPV
ncbi:hypothetical protein RRF57_002328 [Xylaria bambusicola]|uniref:Uncharacterized protein n=1 Tax=Xylaria bambusicola TaxID=326684 RepID=A0AAN7UEE0_9PEZI